MWLLFIQGQIKSLKNSRWSFISDYSSVILSHWVIYKIICLSLFTTTQCNWYLFSLVAPAEKLPARTVTFVQPAARLGSRGRSRFIFIYVKETFGSMKRSMMQNDTTFTIRRAGLHHSGNYSCVYSIRNDSPREETTRFRFWFHVSLYIHVNVISLQLSDCRYFNIWVFNCHWGRRCCFQMFLFWHPANTRQVSSPPLLPEEERAFNVTRRRRSPSKGVNRDLGHYSCVVPTSKCIQEKKTSMDV